MLVHETTSALAMTTSEHVFSQYRSVLSQKQLNGLLFFSSRESKPYTQGIPSPPCYGNVTWLG